MIDKIFFLALVLATPAFAAPSAISNTGNVYVNGNVSIGTLQSNAMLQVNGSLLEIPQKIKIASSLNDNRLAGARDVFVSGKYAYVVSLNSDNLTIMDISDPFSPYIVGSIDGTQLNGASGIFVSGKYAYVASFVGNSFTVVDISNSTYPMIAGFVSDTRLAGAKNVHISGKYAYVASSTNDSLTIIDITNPPSPSIVGHITNNRLDGASDVYVSGKYAYMVAENNMTIVDISNSFLPFIASSVNSTLFSGASNIYVSGKYAYATAFTTGSMVIINISNSSYPVIDGYTSNYRLQGASGIHVIGKYAYVAGGNNDTVSVIDITNPSSPSITDSVSDDALLDGLRGLFVSGKYLYSVATNSARMTVIDISGIDAPAASIGAVETGSLSVTENAVIANDLHVGSGLNVGSNGIYSQGPVAVLSGIAGTAFSVINLAGTTLFSVDSGGRIGINTSSPTSLLHVNGNANITGTLFSSGCVGCMLSGRLDSDVTESGGVMMNISGMNFTVGYNQTWKFAFYMGLNSTSDAGNANFAITAPQQSSCIYTTTGDGGSSANFGWQSVCHKAALYNIPATAPSGAVIHGTIISGNFSGPVTLQFQTSSVGEDSITALRGSYFKAQRFDIKEVDGTSDRGS